MFRPDLLFRLNTIVIRVPPLRERRGDIPGLLRHYLAHYEAQYARPARALANAAQAALLEWTWPGNVRALRHACERAVILAAGAAYETGDFGLGAPAAAPAAASAPASDDQTLGEVERGAIAAALAQAKGNISEAARRLGLSRAALYRKLEKHGL